MEKRSEFKKEQKERFKERSKKAFLMLFCFVFLAVSIATADSATKKMMQCKDDKQAVGLYNMGDNMLRVDFVGEKYFVNIEKEVAFINRAAEYAKEYWNIAYQYAREQIGR